MRTFITHQCQPKEEPGLIIRVGKYNKRSKPKMAFTYYGADVNITYCPFCGLSAEQILRQ